MSKSKKPPAKVGRPVKEPARFTVDEWCDIMGFLFFSTGQEWTSYMDARTRRFVAWWEKSIDTRTRGGGK